MSYPYCKICKEYIADNDCDHLVCTLDNEDSMYCLNCYEIKKNTDEIEDLYSEFEKYKEETNKSLEYLYSEIKNLIGDNFKNKGE